MSDDVVKSLLSQFLLGYMDASSVPKPIEHFGLGAITYAEFLMTLTISVHSASFCL